MLLFVSLLWRLLWTLFFCCFGKRQPWADEMAKEVKEFATRPDDPRPSPRAHIIRENRLPPCEFQGTLALSSSQGCHDMCAPHHTQMNFNHFS